MSGLVVIGAQWGDEGKGKLVDVFTAKAQWVVRFQGGNNAGHTLVVGGKKYKLSLVPSGVLREDCRCVIAAGVVVDPWVLLQEIETLSQAGIAVTPKRLQIDREAHLIMPYHLAIDRAREASRGDGKIGTTGRGIGPAYEDRARRSGIRFAELSDTERLKKHFTENAEMANKYLAQALGSKEVIDAAGEWQKFAKIIPNLQPFVTNASKSLYHAVENGDRVLFEGAQGTLLDQVFGTVPFVTSSHTLAGAVTIGCGLGPKAIKHVLGVAKSYSTRVGAGPFPTELQNETGEHMRKQGHEFGTVTGRPRRCGWLDGVALRRAIRLNGVDSLAITKLDVLSGLPKVKLCVKYKLNGQELDDVPALDHELDRVELEYREFSGWGAEVSRASTWEELPDTARGFLDALSEFVGCRISVVSVGPEREATIFCNAADSLAEFLR